MDRTHLPHFSIISKWDMTIEANLRAQELSNEALEWCAKNAIAKTNLSNTKVSKGGSAHSFLRVVQDTVQEKAIN
jgi:hypothetical protein